MSVNVYYLTFSEMMRDLHASVTCLCLVWRQETNSENYLILALLITTGHRLMRTLANPLIYPLCLPETISKHKHCTVL